jgi:hypothetical protein
MLGTAVCCEGCITEQQQVAPHSVCAEWTFRTRSTGQDILNTSTYIVAVNCDLKIIHDQIKFSLLVRSSFSLLSISILSLSISTHNSAALYAVSNISGTYFFYTNTYIKIFQHESEVTYSQTLQRYISAH